MLSKLSAVGARIFTSSAAANAEAAAATKSPLYKEFQVYR